MVGHVKQAKLSATDVDLIVVVSLFISGVGVAVSNPSFLVAEVVTFLVSAKSFRVSKVDDAGLLSVTASLVDEVLAMPFLVVDPARCPVLAVVDIAIACSVILLLLPSPSDSVADQVPCPFGADGDRPLGGVDDDVSKGVAVVKS